MAKKGSKMAKKGSKMAFFGEKMGFVLFVLFFFINLCVQEKISIYI